MLILASASQSRRAMLDAAGIAHEAVASSVDEAALKPSLAGLEATTTALALAEAKALAVARNHPGRTVLGGDSVVTVEGRRFDKPASRANAGAHLRFFSGRPMTLTSAAVLVTGEGRVKRMVDAATLSVRPLSETFIDSYLDLEWPAIAGCVGCFRMEGRGVQLFSEAKGDHFTILGMPLLMVLDALRHEGLLPA